MKERLVGAAVLVALGVVLIPLLLDGRAPTPANTRVGLTLPGQEPRPSTHTIEIRPDAAKPAGPSRAVGQSASSGPVTRIGESTDKTSAPGDGDSATPAANPAATAQGGASSTGATESRPAATAARSTAAPVAQPVTKPVSKPASNPAPKPAPRTAQKAPPKPVPVAAASPATGEWAVQVGSFGSRENADRLRGQLAGKGFPVFVTQIESRGRTFHRVRVGPAADRAGAEALLRKLGASAPGGKVVRNLP